MNTDVKIKGLRKVKGERLMLKRITICFLLLSTLYFLLSTFVYAEVLERIVAIVNNEVILLSEFENDYRTVVNSGAKTTEREFLDKRINRLLLLEQATKFSFKVSALSHEMPASENDIINEYIERRIKAFIHIPFEEIESYYRSNRESFDNKEFYDVRDEIENYLIEKKLNGRLLEHIKDMRKRSYIRIQLETNSATDLH